uniref:Uncharacterized protein n=1 Tax=Anguilla anguilla TaxID=7936 RepID=A0A0E9QR40_ANGAN
MVNHIKISCLWVKKCTYKMWFAFSVGLLVTDRLTGFQ